MFLDTTHSTHSMCMQHERYDVVRRLLDIQIRYEYSEPSSFLSGTLFSAIQMDRTWKPSWVEFIAKKKSILEWYIFSTKYTSFAADALSPEPCTPLESDKSSNNKNAKERKEKCS